MPEARAITTRSALTRTSGTRSRRTSGISSSSTRRRSSCSSSWSSMTAELAADFEKEMAGSTLRSALNSVVSSARRRPHPICHDARRKAAVLEHSALRHLERLCLQGRTVASGEAVDVGGVHQETAYSRSLRGQAQGSLLIGVLDDGCPFAAAQFLKTSANAAVGTRVRAIWDQNQGKEPVTIAAEPRLSGRRYRISTTVSSIRRDFAAAICAAADRTRRMDQVAFDANRQHRRGWLLRGCRLHDASSAGSRTVRM